MGLAARISAALALSCFAQVKAQSAEEQLAGLQQQCNAMIGERDQVCFFIVLLDVLYFHYILMIGNPYIS